MSTKKQNKKQTVPKVQKKVVVKKPKFKLVSYTLKAVIPVGQYANIQPEVTVQAISIEAAERAVMPYIETLFARYRDGGVKPIEPVVARPVAPVTPTVSTSPTPVKPVAPIAPKAAVFTTSVPVAPVAPAIPLTVPYNRAKSAIDSCLGVDALKLVSDQIEKSTKLIDTEKVALKKLVTAKLSQLNGTKRA